uniref:Inhibitor of nuclear factor kappa-B kinase-interacting protein n=1 Tax=Oncorhynchus mykiss TaxID=8022 RepID=A0A8K9X8S0_ONCMY
MLKALTEILDIKQALDALQAHNSILKMTNELAVVKETLGQLSRGEEQQDNQANSGTLDREGEREGCSVFSYVKLFSKMAALLCLSTCFLAQCEGVQSLLEHLERQPGGLLPHLEALERDVSQLKDWASGLTEKRGLLQDSVAALTEAVGQIEGRTSAITKDVNTKVASVRTDVRRMDGLQSEVESLLEKVRELEERAAQAEHSMVKRIGDLLAGSIDRIQGLKGATERNAQALEQLKHRLPELFVNDQQISERLRELESGRARLVRTVTFAGDLKPKVAAIKRDFGALAPQVDELTLRIGRLAEDLTRREEDIAELRQTFSNLSAVEEDLGVVTQQLSQDLD